MTRTVVLYQGKIHYIVVQNSKIEYGPSYNTEGDNRTNWNGGLGGAAISIS
jgi:hypothetical protein